ncbi:MAG: hypothetical protein AABY18_09470 [Candidatus Thermoplasmatota archaeon]
MPAALALLLIGAAAIVASAQSSESLGLAPGRITIADAQPGQTYRATVTLQNQYDSPTPFTVERNGTVGAWTTVDPGPQFTVPARTSQTVALAIAIPQDTGPGNKTGQISFLADVRGSTRQGVGVLLEVSVGGEGRVKVTWQAATAEDAQVGHALFANVTARNDGNVRTRAQAHASVSAFGGGPALAQGNGSVELDPGQTGDAVISLGSTLPVGQYLVRVTSTDPAGFEVDLDVKVTVSGDAPDGRLRAIVNPIRVPAGKPVTVNAWFENTGRSDIGSARLSAQVLRDGKVEATLGSDGLAVVAGAHANLTAIWTPAREGNYRIVGHVEYDGFRTPDSEGRIEVGPGGFNQFWLVVGMLAVALVAGVVVIALIVRGRRARRPARPRS